MKWTQWIALIAVALMVAPAALAYQEKYKTLGDEDAPVTIEWYSDPECPFCGRWYRDTFPEIYENYVEDGDVKIVYRHFPLSFHQNAFDASKAIECAADKDVMYEYIEYVYNNQDQLDYDYYLRWAGWVGMDESSMAHCLDKDSTAEDVEDDIEEGEGRGVRGTPAFFINGELVSGAHPYSTFEEKIEALLDDDEPPMDDAFRDTLREGETKTYHWGGEEYEITLAWVSNALYWEDGEEHESGQAADAQPLDNQPSAKFVINDELTAALHPGERDSTECGTIKVESIGNSVTASGDQGQAEFTFWPRSCSTVPHGYVKLYEGDVHAVYLDGKRYQIMLEDAEQNHATFSVWASEYEGQEVTVRVGQYGQAEGMKFHLLDTDYVTGWAVIGKFSATSTPAPIEDSLREGDTENYWHNNRNYELTLTWVSNPLYWEDKYAGAAEDAPSLDNRPSAKFMLEGQVSRALHVGEKQELRCGTIKVTRIDHGISPSADEQVGVAHFELWPKACPDIVPNDEPDVTIVVGHQAPTSDILDAIDLARALQEAGPEVDIIHADEEVVNPIAVGMAMLDIDAYEQLDDSELTAGLVFVLYKKHAMLLKGKKMSGEEHQLANVGWHHLRGDGFETISRGYPGTSRKYLLVENMITLFDEPTDEGVEGKLKQGECETYELYDYELKVCVDGVFYGFVANCEPGTGAGKCLPSPNQVVFSVNGQRVQVAEGGTSRFTSGNFRGALSVKDIDNRVVVFWITGHRTTPNPTYCTSDAKLCPDGSSVGRDPNNNCAFYPCPAVPEPECEDGGTLYCDSQGHCDCYYDEEQTPECDGQLVCYGQGYENCVCYDNDMPPPDDEEPTTECMDGCASNGRCLPYGTRLANGVATYCSIFGEFVNQQRDGSACQNDYECVSNQCYNAVCKSLDLDIAENTNLLQRIASWIRNIFG